MEYEVRNCSRKCSATDRTLEPGEVYFSLLEWQENGVQRRDFSVDAWPGPPEECIGWWRSRLAAKDADVPKLAPTDVMLNLFESLEEHAGEEEFRYLLGLLLLRRKIIRREESRLDEQGREVLAVRCPKRDKDYELVVAEPKGEQATKLQLQMFDLLYGCGQVPTTDSEQNQRAA